MVGLVTVAASHRTAVITGAARGIGRAVAVRLAGQGWHLVLVDRCIDDPNLGYPLATPEDLVATVAACGGSPQAMSLVGDVRDQALLDHAVDLARHNQGGLDAAIAAAGCVGGGTAWDDDEALWQTMIEVNLTGVWRLARAAVPAMLERPSPRTGRFVAISSAGGTIGLPQLSAYVAAKHGVHGFVRSLAAELGPHGITANAIAPGSTSTAMLEASALVYGMADSADFGEHHLLDRLIDPDEVAAMAAWLCGPDSGAVTGAVLAVDAGMTAR